MYTVEEISNYFLKKSFENKIPIDRSKLQKLVYYSYCWYLVIENKPLFNEYIEVRSLTPTISSLHCYYRQYGLQEIFTYLPSPKTDGDVEDSFTIGDLQFLENIWEIYGSLSTFEISKLIANENSPIRMYRRKVKKQKRDMRDNEHLPDEVIIECFSKKLNPDKQIIEEDHVDDEL